MFPFGLARFLAHEARRGAQRQGSGLERRAALPAQGDDAVPQHALYAMRFAEHAVDTPGFTHVRDPELRTGWKEQLRFRFAHTTPNAVRNAAATRGHTPAGRTPTAVLRSQRSTCEGPERHVQDRRRVSQPSPAIVASPRCSSVRFREARCSICNRRTKCARVTVPRSPHRRRSPRGRTRHRTPNTGGTRGRVRRRRRSCPSGVAIGGRKVSMVRPA